MKWDGRIQANSLHIPLASESVHMVATSPPYFSLRRYEIPPTVYGGNPRCDHQFGSMKARSQVRHKEYVAGKTRTDDRTWGNDPTRRFNGQHEKHSAGSHCIHCGAYFGWLGLEETINEYVEHMVLVFDEVWRVLRKDGIVFLNIGDSYSNSGGRGAQGLTSQRVGRNNVLEQMKIKTQKPPEGLKPKDACGIPWRLVLALQDRGWFWRSTIVWQKPNCMPSSQRDRPTSSWEPIFLLAKSRRYFYDYVNVMEPVTGNANPRGSALVANVVFARYQRDVWTIPSEPMSEEHYAVYPEGLVEPMILAGTSDHGCCAQCGRQYERIVEKQSHGDASTDQQLKSDGVKRMQGGAKYKKLRENDAQHRLAVSVSAARGNGSPHDQPFLPPKTIGWKKPCKCETDERRPSIVLDPFAGSNTTGRVAEALNRHWISLDMGYQDMQKRRLYGVQKVLTALR